MNAQNRAEQKYVSDEYNMDNMWHTGLHARLDTSFPKKCMNCGRIFATAEQYFTETQDINEHDRGLKSFVDDDTATVVEAFRNCPCGSTLMETFDDHRDSLHEVNTGNTEEKEFVRSMKTNDPVARNASSGSLEDLLKSLESGLSELDLLRAEEKWHSKWYSGLRPRGEAVFPKTCRSCDRVYETPEDFFTETDDIKVDASGLKQCINEDDKVIIEAYRN
ncbi:MAG: hypothetical protein HQ492_01985, partial [Woeseiaceae bacterium]|nr:hypothetical protein [Woeseiaceae bacterium]